MDGWMDGWVLWLVGVGCGTGRECEAMDSNSCLLRLSCMQSFKELGRFLWQFQ